MSFPREEDADRLIAMHGGDKGFFVVAVYSFIEQYLKNEIRYFGGYADNKDYFSDLLYKFEKQFRKRYFGYKPTDHDFLFGMIRGKENANRVRHQFDDLSDEEVLGAIKDLLKFCGYVNNYWKNKFAPLERNLDVWKNRQAPDKTAKELEEANKLIAEMNKNLTKMIAESDDYKRLKDDLEEGNLRCLLLEKENRDLSEEADRKKEELEKQISEYEEKQNIMQERFCEYENYISNLRRMLTYTRTRNDFERTIITLTPEQQVAVDRIKIGSPGKDYLVKGPAGTGKSLVLLKTIEKLTKESAGTGGRIVFVTYTTSLVKYNKYVASLMNMGLSSDVIESADSYFCNNLSAFFPKKHIKYGIESSYKDIAEKIINDDYAEEGIGAAEVLDEAVHFVWPNLITREEYIDEGIERTGMGTGLKNDKRKIYWEIIGKLEEEAEKSSNWQSDFAKSMVCRFIKENPVKEEDKNLDYIFIDESQDLSIASMFWFKSICRHSVIMAGDTDQMIFNVQPPIVRSGIDVRGTSCVLKTNLRNTIQINDAAEKYRKLIHGMSSDSNPSSFRMGPPVELVEVNYDDTLTGNQNAQELIDVTAKRVKMCISELGYAPENICVVFSYTNNKRTDMLEKKLGGYGILVENIKDKDFSVGGKVCVSTVQSCKGLDFPVVILVAEHRPHVFAGGISDASIERIQRNMFYVAMTRAMDMLTVITYSNTSNDVINDMKKCCSA